MKRQRTFMVVLAVFLSGIVLATSIGFNAKFRSHVQSDVRMRLQEMVNVSAISFEMQIEEQVRKVRTLADFLGESGLAFESPETLSLLQAAAKNNGLLRCALAFPDGRFITHDSINTGNVAQDAFFIANMRGEFYITDPRPAVVDPTKTVVLFSSPVVRNGQIIGSLIYSYLCNDMDRIFNFSFLQSNGELQVVKQDGSFLIGYSSLFGKVDNLPQLLREKCTHQTHEAQDCLSIADKEGYSIVTQKAPQETYLLNYKALEIKDWYMLSIVSEDAASNFVSSASNDQRYSTLSVVFCVALYLLAALVLWLSNRNNVDRLTGVMTIGAFKRRAARLLKQAAKQETPLCYVMVKLDVKNFKIINRIYDFAQGDRLIRNMALSLRSVVEKGAMGLVARANVDTFVLLLPYQGRDQLDKQRADFIEEFRILMGSDFTTTVEFPTGQYVIDPDEIARPNIGEMLEKVNFAHRDSKHRDVLEIVDYEENIEREALLEKAIEDKMSPALTNDEFQLYLQPKYRVGSEEICGAEALVRWKVGNEFYMHPTAFIPILERNGFIVKIDMYMFERAVEKLRSMMDAGHPIVPISVNFSRTHLNNDHFVQDLCDICAYYEVPREYLEIEVTEYAVFSNLRRMIGLIDELHASGFSISMDDFGSGYSSLSLLKDLMVDVIKLDKSFFDPSDNPERAKTVVTHIINMARGLEVQTVAEGIETREQVDMMCELGCDIIQGYYYSKPIPGSCFDTVETTPVVAKD